MKNIIILHDFDGRPYFKGVENVSRVTYLNTRPFRFLFRDLIKLRKIKKETLQSVFFLFLMPFMKDRIIILGMAPFNYRIVIYGWLFKRNKLILHTSWHQWETTVPFEYIMPIKSIMIKVWRWFLPKFKVIVSVTKKAEESLSKTFPDIKLNIITIPHVIDIEPLSVDEVRAKWNGDIIKFLFTGRLTKAKGITQFIELAKYSSLCKKKILFEVAGRGELESEVKNYIINYPNMLFHGFIDERLELKKIIASSHFLLLPSRKINGWEELFGLVIIEAMSQGCVVIASDHVGPTEIITSFHNGELVKEDEFVQVGKKIIDELDYESINTIYSVYAQNALETSKGYVIDAISKKWSVLFNNF